MTSLKEQHIYMKEEEEQEQEQEESNGRIEGISEKRYLEKKLLKKLEEGEKRKEKLKNNKNLSH